MIINYETRETINNFVNEYVPEGIHEQFHVDCREQVVMIIEALIEKDIINGDINKLVESKDDIIFNEECQISKIYEKYCINYEEKIKNIGQLENSLINKGLKLIKKMYRTI